MRWLSKIYRHPFSHSHRLLQTLLFLGCFLFLFWGTAGALAAEEPAHPRIRFEKLEYDFGILRQGATVAHTFTFENQGASRLEISSVQSSCGCTAVLSSGRNVEPGEKSTIEVQYDSRGKLGRVHKVVQVYSNDPKSPIVYLSMNGEVTPSEHPEMTGTRNLFEGSCRHCHADRGTRKRAAALYSADCAMCHENHHRGGNFIAPDAARLGRLSRRRIRSVVLKGRRGTSMPAFGEDRGGPLSAEQVESLVEFLFAGNRNR